jgi:hypothetical protein
MSHRLTAVAPSQESVGGVGCLQGGANRRSVCAQMMTEAEALAGRLERLAAMLPAAAGFSTQPMYGTPGGCSAAAH